MAAGIASCLYLPRPRYVLAHTHCFILFLGQIGPLIQGEATSLHTLGTPRYEQLSPTGCLACILTVVLGVLSRQL